MDTLKTFEKKLTPLSLSSGCHSTAAVGVCAMEAVAYIAGERHSDHPECVCPVITAFVLHWNDMLKTNFSRDCWIKPLVPLLVNSRPKDAGSEHYFEVLRKRALLCINFACHTAVPLGLNALRAQLASNGFSKEAAGVQMHIEILRNLGCVTAGNMEAMNAAVSNAVDYVAGCKSEENIYTLADTFRCLNQAKESTGYFDSKVFTTAEYHTTRYIEGASASVASLSLTSLNYTMGRNADQTVEDKASQLCVSLVHKMLAVR